MAILSDYEEDQQEPRSSSSSGKPFNAALDPSNPLGFLETALQFLAKESDLFKSDSLAKDVNAVVRQVKEKVDAEERKRKEKAAQDIRGKAEKKIKEEKPSGVVKEEVKEAEVESKKISEEAKEDAKDDEKGPRGKFFSLLSFLRFEIHMSIVWF